MRKWSLKSCLSHGGRKQKAWTHVLSLTETPLFPPPAFDTCSLDTYGRNKLVEGGDKGTSSDEEEEEGKKGGVKEIKEIQQDTVLSSLKLSAGNLNIMLWKYFERDLWEKTFQSSMS
jgi:hypothetical protein